MSDHKRRCYHNSTWIIAGGRWEWCYRCGALREMRLVVNANGCTPITQWQRPTGNTGLNPWPLKPLKRVEGEESADGK